MDDSNDDPRKMIDLPTVHKAYLVEKTWGETGVRCCACAQACEIAEGETGLCGTKINIERELYTMNYGDVIVAESRPVEIKPFFHFHPGKTLMTIAAPGCNLSCPWCQNSELSRARPRPLVARQVPMNEVIEAAEAAGDIGVCVSLTEPMTLFEYSLGLFREAGAHKMVTTFVSNGYLTPEAVHMLARAGLSAINVDVKGSERVYRELCGGRAGDEPVWETVKNAAEMGVHVEVTHLVVTGLSDTEESFRAICEKHLEFAGPDIPLHITAYRPAGGYDAPPTPVEFLERAHAVARDMGLRFPYVGNIPGHPLANTVCPECGELCLERLDDGLARDLTSEYRCPGCGYRLPIVT
ncbi:MAG: radical SAM protein [Actinobacteria bacterium]|nr:radical SAM protein [Actinomycetota bacterium]MBU1944144.1 radical SAM protein [Actinomycetota bacterium]MBU2687463.1 radical SAM protein [Actinomycetota bacterium]